MLEKQHFIEIRAKMNIYGVNKKYRYNEQQEHSFAQLRRTKRDFVFRQVTSFGISFSDTGKYQ